MSQPSQASSDPTTSNSANNSVFESLRNWGAPQHWSRDEKLRWIDFIWNPVKRAKDWSPHSRDGYEQCRDWLQDLKEMTDLFHVKSKLTSKTGVGYYCIVSQHTEKSDRKDVFPREEAEEMLSRVTKYEWSENQRRKWRTHLNDIRKRRQHSSQEYKDEYMEYSTLLDALQEGLTRVYMKLFDIGRSDQPLYPSGLRYEAMDKTRAAWVHPNSPAAYEVEGRPYWTSEYSRGTSKEVDRNFDRLQTCLNSLPPESIAKIRYSVTDKGREIHCWTKNHQAS